MKKFWSFIYMKNWQFDRVEEPWRFLLFMGIAAACVVVHGLLYFTGIHLEREILVTLSNLFFFLVVGAFAIFRIPYVEGKIEKPAQLERKTEHSK